MKSIFNTINDDVLVYIQVYEEIDIWVTLLSLFFVMSLWQNAIFNSRVWCTFMPTTKLIFRTTLI